MNYLFIRNKKETKYKKKYFIIFYILKGMYVLEVTRKIKCDL